MKLIGISGRARAGKDTAADILVKDHGFTKIALADPLKRICLEVFNGKMTERHLWGDGRDEPIAELGGLTARKALQMLGTEWGRATHPDVWIDYALSVITQLEDLKYGYDPRRTTRQRVQLGLTIATGWRDKPIERWVISDVRFKNEAAAIRKAGGEVWRIIRPGAGLEGDAAAHVSENELPEAVGRTRRLYAADGDPVSAVYAGIIHNGGDLAKLERAVAFMLEAP